MREYLVDLRTQRSESQQDVANAVGISRQYYAMIESGERQKKMDITLLTALSRHFDVPVAKLIDMEQSDESIPQSMSNKAD